MPAFKLLCAEAGLSGELARWCCTKSQVAGVICITPRAPAEDVNPLLKPLSCQARPAATDGGTAWAVATERISEAVVRWPVGCRGGGGAEAGSGARGGPPTNTPGASEAEGIMIVRPSTTWASGDRPL